MNRARHPAGVAFNKILPAAILAGLGSTLSNTQVWLAGMALDRVTIGLSEVIIFSLIGVVGGAALYAILSKTARRPLRLFIIITILFIALYTIGPLVAAQAPYMAGVERFNLTTLIATELMHLLSGAWIVGCFTRWAQLKVVDNRD